MKKWSQALRHERIEMKSEYETKKQWKCRLLVRQWTFLQCVRTFDVLFWKHAFVCNYVCSNFLCVLVCVAVCVYLRLQEWTEININNSMMWRSCTKSFKHDKCYTFISLSYSHSHIHIRINVVCGASINFSNATTPKIVHEIYKCIFSSDSTH